MTEDNDNTTTDAEQNGNNEVATDGGYDFLGDSPRRDDRTYGYEQHGASWWGLGEHTEQSTDWDAVFEDLDDLQSQVPDGLKGLLDDAERQAQNMRNSGFECGVCGLSHGHSTDKHDVRDFFGVTDEFAGQMHFNPYCHCGVNELARLLNYFRSIEVQVFENEGDEDFDIDELKREVRNGAGHAPIRDETQRELEDTLGPL